MYIYTYTYIYLYTTYKEYRIFWRSMSKKLWHCRLPFGQTSFAQRRDDDGIEWLLCAWDGYSQWASVSLQLHRVDDAAGNLLFIWYKYNKRLWGFRSHSAAEVWNKRETEQWEKIKPELSSSLRIFSLTSSSHCCRIWTASSIEQFSTRMLSIASSLSPSSSVPVLKEEPLIGCLPDNFRLKQNILGINHLTFLSTIQ